MAAAMEVSRRAAEQREKAAHDARLAEQREQTEREQEAATVRRAEQEAAKARQEQQEQQELEAALEESRRQAAQVEARRAAHAAAEDERAKSEADAQQRARARSEARFQEERRATEHEKLRIIGALQGEGFTTVSIEAAIEVVGLHEDHVRAFISKERQKSVERRYKNDEQRAAAEAAFAKQSADTKAAADQQRADQHAREALQAALVVEGYKRSEIECAIAAVGCDLGAVRNRIVIDRAKVEEEREAGLQEVERVREAERQKTEEARNAERAKEEETRAAEQAAGDAERAAAQAEQRRRQELEAQQLAEAKHRAELEAIEAKGRADAQAIEVKRRADAQAAEAARLAEAKRFADAQAAEATRLAEEVAAVRQATTQARLQLHLELVDEGFNTSAVQRAIGEVCTSPRAASGEKDAVRIRIRLQQQALKDQRLAEEARIAAQREAAERQRAEAAAVKEAAAAKKEADNAARSAKAKAAKDALDAKRKAEREQRDQQEIERKQAAAARKQAEDIVLAELLKEGGHQLVKVQQAIRSVSDLTKGAVLAVLMIQRTKDEEYVADLGRFDEAKNADAMLKITEGHQRQAAAKLKAQELMGKRVGIDGIGVGTVVRFKKGKVMGMGASSHEIEFDDGPSQKLVLQRFKGTKANKGRTFVLLDTEDGSAVAFPLSAPFNQPAPRKPEPPAPAKLPGSHLSTPPTGPAQGGAGLQEAAHGETQEQSGQSEINSMFEMLASDDGLNRAGDGEHPIDQPIRDLENLDHQGHIEARVALSGGAGGGGAGAAAEAETIDAFLSHNGGQDELGRDNHARVEQVNAALRGLDNATWFNERRGGRGREQDDDETQHKIDIAAGVIIFVTRDYIELCKADEGNACQFEFNYAAERKGVKRVVPVAMEPGVCDPDSWDGPVGDFFAVRDPEMAVIDMSGDELGGAIDELSLAILTLACDRTVSD